MKDIISQISTGSSDGLAELFRIGTDAGLLSPETLQESLEHLLSIGIDSALNQLPRKLAGKLREGATNVHVFKATQESGISTFGELLDHPNPALAMVRFAKDFGKAICRHGSCPWPAKVGEALYYGAYAAGLVRLRQRVGTLDDQDLHKAFRKLAARSWIGGSLKRLFERASTQFLLR